MKRESKGVRGRVVPGGVSRHLRAVAPGCRAFLAGCCGLALGAVALAQVSVDNNEIVVYGGWDDGATKVVQVVDPTTYGWAVDQDRLAALWRTFAPNDADMGPHGNEEIGPQFGVPLNNTGNLGYPFSVFKGFRRNNAGAVSVFRDTMGFSAFLQETDESVFKTYSSMKVQEGQPENIREIGAFEHINPNTRLRDYGSVFQNYRGGSVFRDMQSGVFTDLRNPDQVEVSDWNLMSVFKGRDEEVEVHGERPVHRSVFRDRNDKSALTWHGTGVAQTVAMPLMQIGESENAVYAFRVSMDEGTLTNSLKAWGGEEVPEDAGDPVRTDEGAVELLGYAADSYDGQTADMREYAEGSATGAGDLSELTDVSPIAEAPNVLGLWTWPQMNPDPVFTLGGGWAPVTSGSVSGGGGNGFEGFQIDASAPGFSEVVSIVHALVALACFVFVGLSLRGAIAYVGSGA